MLLADIIDRATASFGDALPRLVGALVLLVIGLLLAPIVARFVRNALGSAGLDRLGERFGARRVLARIGFERPLSALVAIAIRIAILVVTIVAALSLLGLAALSTALNELILFLPNLFIALVLVLAGFVVAELVGARVQGLATQMDLPGPFRQVVEAAIIALFLLTALAQIGVRTTILTGLMALIIVAVSLTFALAFGLGGRDVARQLSAGRYVGNAYRVGDQIEVAGFSGRISRIESATTVLEAGDGRSIRIPNHILLESVVIVGAGNAERG
ncbi:MAG: mechanosensitive ion channel [Actinomycetota bacterium]|nr:mechanosensitive ion channel [Actinomycetota bacterium]